MNMGAVFRNAVARYPHRTALFDPAGEVSYTYAEWDERVDEVGAALQSAGMAAGDRVAISLENRAETLTLFWATQKIGAEFVPLNFRAAGEEVAYLVNNVDAKLLFFADVSRDGVLAGRESFDTVEELIYVDEDVPEGVTAFAAFLDRGGDLSPRFVDADEISQILHTSGTTGNPKAVPISHQANYARAMGNPIHLDWRQGESTLGIMPNFHEMGRAAITSSALLNGTYVAQRQWSCERGYELIEEYGIEILYLVPTMFHDLVDCEARGEYDVGSVRTVSYAGTAMSERVHEEVPEIFDPDSFTNFYGSSEMNCMATCSWLDEKPGCAGRAGVHTRVRVVEPVEGETVSPDAAVPTDELGELIIDAGSAEAFEGYLDNPAANEKSYEDGWFFTGDLGYRDGDGDLWVVGRVDDMIISGGENIYPIEIEDLLDGHELIDDVAIGSITDERWGEVVTAYVTPRREGDYDAMAAELDQYCRDNEGLADFKRPRRYVFIEEVPKSNVGKKLRRKLRTDTPADLDLTIKATVDLASE
jgi:2-furoate---CoA ligase